ncbi:MFS transporter [Thermoflavimicrobium dichotomicum]|uniref:MFS-type transporter involved in bile tolerance, Atg22 family n=1 Tax=Thermoflavimicrobium dichotomicum TaxID=46223 RepID=A0A1I3UI07_9BACL|nr:MFS transporter [Thermoflavimicrobium dichotomicum]SFJ81496.1 MFS-type transporter involved in bile tolerance, Atg22 family [Thermoflavimicrobium dichotomicum]
MLTLIKNIWSTVFKSFQLPRDYITFLAGLLVSRLGDSLNAFAIPWISYQLTGSAIVMGSLFAISVLPIVLFGSVVGVFVDRWDRRKLMLTADITRALLVGLIPILHLLNLLSLWHLYVISFILAVLSLLFDVATISSIPQMAGNDLTRANAGYQLVNQLADLAGPTLAGVIVAAIGGFHTLWIDVLSFAATFLAIFRLPSLGSTHLTDDRKNNLRNMAKDIVEGFKWLMHDRLNFSLSLQAMVGNFGASAVLAVFMYYLLSTLHLNSQQSGFNYTLIGIGGLIGSMVVIPLDKRFRRGVLIPILLGIGAIGLVFAITSRFWLAPGIALGIATVCNVSWNSIVASVRQETVPSDMLGRVLGFSRVFTRLAMPLGAFVGSFISSINPSAVFVLAAVTKGLEVVIALVSPIRKL